jgi:hypothetical protein
MQCPASERHHAALHESLTNPCVFDSRVRLARAASRTAQRQSDTLLKREAAQCAPGIEFTQSGVLKIFPAPFQRETGVSPSQPWNLRFAAVWTLWIGLFAPLICLAQAASQPGSAPLRRDFSADMEARRSYVIPAAEIAAFQFLLNRVDRHLYGNEYRSDWSSIKRNLHSSWVTDNDPYKINQFLHPYAGSIYHGFARSAGLSYWESLGYSFAGSAVWEIAGETTPPSRNDQISTGIGGSFLGEALFRISHLVREQGGGSRLWREVTAAAIAPSAAFNRYAFGERFRDLFDARDPAYYSKLQFGTGGTTHNRVGNSEEPQHRELLVEYSMDYGLPGKQGYRYTRPFDYFNFQVNATSSNAIHTLSTRGLLLGTDYELGDRYRGLWGLYGSYDYFAPQLFRISSTALSLGTTGQWRISESIALQGSLLAGLGYSAVGSLHGNSDTAYHYGMTPQALAALRVIFGDAAALDLTARDYLVKNVAGSAPAGRDNIAQADLTLTLRIQRQHGIAIKYLWARRDATFPGLSDPAQPTNLTQVRGTIGIYYTVLGRDGFGAVDWR